MSEPSVLHIDPSESTFTTSLKEAVIEGLVRRAHGRLTGKGEHGQVVFGDPPTKFFAAGFLLPGLRRSSEPDGSSAEIDITSPVHLSTLGMSFQVARDVPGTLSFTPKGSVYVRILPTETDMARSPTTFGLEKSLRGDMRRMKGDLIRSRLADAGLGVRGETDLQREQIAAIKKSAQEDAFLEATRQAGISVAVTDKALPNVVLGGDLAAIAQAEARMSVNGADSEDLAVLQAQEGSGDDRTRGEDDRTTFSWTVGHGDPGPLPDDRAVQPGEVPQKWLRLEVGWPTLTIDPSWEQARIDEACKQHSDEMQRSLHQTVVQWQGAEGALGGRDWAMPRATSQNQLHQVLPSQVARWDTHLATLRTSGHPKAVPELKLQLEIRVVDDPLDASRRTVRAVLANRSAVVDPTKLPDKLLDRTLYLAGLDAVASPGLHRNHVLERVRPSYRWNKWLEHAGLGINCGLECERPDGENGIALLLTTFLPDWRQPRITPHRIKTPPTFETMAAQDGGLPAIEALIQDYRAWIDETVASEPWRMPASHVTARHDETREKVAFGIDLAAWERELARIRIGYQVLRECRDAVIRGVAENDESVAPLRAWRATNASFLRVSVEARKRGQFAPSAWHLFQMAFLVSHLPGVISRLIPWSHRTDLYIKDESMATDDATASLLYFPTGGGKSEAFFGLLILQAFVDRIRGKARGVTAIVRYPLRLLTTQQANRFARTLAMAELERRQLRIPGDPFQIGFWVGGGNTPNYPSARIGFNDLPVWKPDNLTVGAEARLAHDDKDYQAVSKWRRLTECPFCAAKPVALRRQDVGNRDTRLAHVCLSGTCSWNALHGQVEPLPFHVMDTDIYAYAPTVLLGTVDKMAAIAHSPATIAAVFGMFGFAPWMVERLDEAGKPLPGHGRLKHPRKPSFRPGATPNDNWADPARNGCVPIGPVYGNARVELFDPFPSIEVQDEAHLLEKSLGTFSGLFGSMLETAFADLSRYLGHAQTSRLANGNCRRAKVVAASATVQGPERQIQMLYQRRVTMFPHPGHDLYESFFARLEKPNEVERAAIFHPELRTPMRRLYVSMPTNGRPHTSATVAVLSALHLTLTETFGWAVSDTRVDRDRVREALGDNLPPGPLQAIHRAALGSATDDQMAEALDLARIVLCYVTSKKGGDSVQAALGEFVPRDHQRAGLELGLADGVKTGLITGSIEIDTIQEIVEQAKPGWRPGLPVDKERDFLGALRGIVATAAISHGVDIERLNEMVFAGLPSDIAEYVQASSRVGRTHVGVSILVPTPQRLRDVHVVGIHDVFHRFLERMVQPAAVDRWGENAIDRVVASALQVKTCAVDHYIRLSKDVDDVERRRHWDSSGVGPLRAQVMNDFITINNETISFLSRAVGIERATDPRHDPIRESYGPIEVLWYDDLLKAKVRNVLENMKGETYAASSLRTFWHGTHRPEPMTSLRDVDETGKLVAAHRSVINNELVPDGMTRLMRRLRQGDGSWSEGEGDLPEQLEMPS